MFSNPFFNGAAKTLATTATVTAPAPELSILVVQQQQQQQQQEPLINFDAKEGLELLKKCVVLEQDPASDKPIEKGLLDYLQVYRVSTLHHDVRASCAIAFTESWLYLCEGDFSPVVVFIYFSLLTASFRSFQRGSRATRLFTATRCTL